MLKKTDLNGIELAIVIKTSNYNPKILNLNFLKSSMIVPQNWNNGQQIVCKNQISQVIFRDRINIIAEATKITFIENIDLEALSSSNSPNIALRYTDILSALINISYFSVNIIFKGYVLFPQNSDLPHRYIFQKLIRPAVEEWTEITSSAPQASVNFFYSLVDKELKLSIDEGTLKTLEQDKSPIILFTGNFNYIINDENSTVQSMKNCQVISGWLHDLEIYIQIVNKLLSLNDE